MTLVRMCMRGGGGRMALALTCFLSGCRIGTSLPEEETRDLTMAEVEAVTSAIVKAALESTVFSSQQVLFTHSHGPAGVHSHPAWGPFVHAVPIDGPLPSGHNLFNANLLEDVACGSGGDLRIEAEGVGEGNPLVEPGFVDYTVGVEPLACFLSVEVADGGRIQITSPPYVTGEAHSRYDGGSVARVFGALTGGFGWQAESKAGQCELEVTFDVTGPTLDGIAVVPVVGTVCALDVTVPVPFS